MVWGLNLPSSFGEFWPDGNFEGATKSSASGWRLRLTAYYEGRSAEEQKRLFDYRGDPGNAAHFYAGFVNRKFTNEVGMQLSADQPALTPIEPHEPPHAFVTCKSYSELGSLIMLNDRIIAVDELLKAVIERIDPGAHQFFPIRITMPKGADFPRRFHVLVIGRYCDSFSPDDSSPASYRVDGDFTFKHVERKTEMTRLTFSSASFGNANLWRERRRREGLTLFSDNLKFGIDEADLRLPKLYRMREI